MHFFTFDFGLRRGTYIVKRAFLLSLQPFGLDSPTNPAAIRLAHAFNEIILNLQDESRCVFFNVSGGAQGRL
jgi:hypothetical protein